MHVWSDVGTIAGDTGGWDNAFYWAWGFIDQFDTNDTAYCARTWYGGDAWLGNSCRSQYTDENGAEGSYFAWFSTPQGLKR
ncbi:MAG TPA: hypothetical protein VM163_07940 [bacterium]|nr:hypothetical protein [bacterium]